MVQWLEVGLVKSCSLQSQFGHFVSSGKSFDFFYHPLHAYKIVTGGAKRNYRGIATPTCFSHAVTLL